MGRFDERQPHNFHAPYSSRKAWIQGPRHNILLDLWRHLNSFGCGHWSGKFGPFCGFAAHAQLTVPTKEGKEQLLCSEENKRKYNAAARNTCCQSAGIECCASGQKFAWLSVKDNKNDIGFQL